MLLFGGYTSKDGGYFDFVPLALILYIPEVLFWLIILSALYLLAKRSKLINTRLNLKKKVFIVIPSLIIPIVRTLILHNYERYYFNEQTDADIPVLEFAAVSLAVTIISVQLIAKYRLKK